MSEINVSNSAQLKSALSAAKAGDTIVLESGNYGEVDLKGYDFKDYVTLKSADSQDRAVFDDIQIEDSSYLRLDDIHVDSNGARAGIWISSSHHIDVINSEVNGPIRNSPPIDKVGFGIEVREGSHHINLEGNYVHHVLNGIVNFGTDDFELVGNTVNYVGADAYKFAGVDGGLIKNNFGPTHFYPTDDAHADFMQFQGDPSSNLVIEGNVLLLQNRFDMQGIFFGGTGGHNNLLITDNIVYTQMANGISINEGNGNTITITHNTLINALSDVGPVTRINAPSASNSQYNIVSQKKGEIAGNNIEVQHRDPKADFHFSDLFVNAHRSQGISLEDLLPVEGSLAETYGAIDRLTELLDMDEPDPRPEPTPEPEPDPEPTPDPDPIEPPDDGGVSDDPGDKDVPAPGEVPDGAAYAMLGSNEVSGAADVVEVAHSKALELSSATVSLTFNADTVSGFRGLVSKDATGDGHHFISYIKDGSLYIRVQDGDDTETIQIKGIRANTDYDMQFAIGDGGVSVWLDGTLVGAGTTNMDWSENGEHLQIGAMGWSSGEGKSGFKHVFDGTISNVLIAQGLLSPTEMASILDGDSKPSPTPSPEDATPGDDVLSGDDGDNIIKALNGDDKVSGLGGDDRLFGQRGQDKLYGQAGDDLVVGGRNSDSLFGGQGADTLDGGRGNDDLNGGGGKDELNGGLGADMLTGGDGADEFVIDSESFDGTKDTITDFDLREGDRIDLRNLFEGSDLEDTSILNAIQLESNGSDALVKIDESMTGTDFATVAVIKGASDLTLVDLIDAGGLSVSGEVVEADIADTVFSLKGQTEFSGVLGDVINLSHRSGFEIEEGTIAFSFNADTVKGRSGLISKDAAGYDGGGNHFSAWIDKGKLHVRFQDDDSDATFEFANVKANKTYDFAAYFKEDEVGVYVNDKLIGSSKMTMDWTDNAENLQVGALGWHSESGGRDAKFTFDGTITDLAILNAALTPQELDFMI